MTFIHYLKDQLSLIFLWIGFVMLTGFILWLTPDVFLNLSSLLYIYFLGLLLLFIYFVFDYLKKKKWWEELGINSDYTTTTPRLHSAQSEEEKVYQTYFNELHQEHFMMINNAKKQAQEQKDYIDSWVHEIKVPLSSLILIVENIEDDISEKRYIQLDENLQRMDDYVEQVMYYSRLDHFSQDYLIRPCSLKKVVQQAVKHSANYFIQKGLKFTIEGEDYSVLTDEKWLLFILNQLIGNAIKYTPRGGMITVILKKNSRGTWLNVSDSGIGIPMEDQQRIFEKGFTGANGRNDEISSTGLGLYLAKSLTEKMSHHIYVESVVGEGTTFQLLFPNLDFYTEEDENDSIFL